jgi:hypothetical protein
VIDNLFIVESPLQALVAVELSLQFEGQLNGIIYRLSGEGRERNDQQIMWVIERGDWSFQEPLQFAKTGGLAWHINCRKYIGRLRKRFGHKVLSLFIGEFRSQWMHLARFAIAPQKTVLMDDGAATLTVKDRYIDHGIYYPKDLWTNTSVIKRVVKATIFFGLSEKVQAREPLSFASAFLGDESEFDIDFSAVRKKFKQLPASDTESRPKAYFFGSKYSEAGILSRTYELGFISDIANYYQAKGLELVYCAHRDESAEKLNVIRSMPGLEVARPDLPAELFLLECGAGVSEIGAAYSSVVNNLSLMFPDKPITSFRLYPDAVNPKNRPAIDDIYRHFEQKGILVQNL